MKVRVAHIINSLGIGGAERHVVNLLNAMPCDYRAIICLTAPRPTESFRRDLQPDIEQFCIPVSRWSMPVGIYRIAQVLRKGGVNVVHTHMYRANLYGAIAARLAGVPAVFTTEHGENPWKKPVHRYIERRVITPLVRKRFCVSPRILEIRRDAERIEATKLTTTVNGTVIPEACGFKPSNDVLTVGAVGRLITAKDYPGLLVATAALKEKGLRMRLLVAGDGPEKGRLAALASELGISDSVEFLGFVRNVHDFYRSLDLFVIPSVREGLPVALLEAMAHNLPVIATDVGALSETVKDGVGGIVVPAGDRVALANAMEKLLRDVKLREELARGARSRVESHYSVEAVANTHMEHYHRSLASAEFELH